MADLILTEQILGDLIAFPTVSTDSNVAMMNHMADRLDGIASKIEILPDETGTKANMFATIGPDVPGGLVLSGHADVVPVTDQDWSHDPFQMADADDRLFGRGTCDMKGFIAACIAAAPDFADLPLRRPIHLAFTHDEETGCLGAQAMLPQLVERGYAPSMALIGEPTGLKVIEGHKGCCEYTTRFSGLEGHGSSPDLGVNAVIYAARYMAQLLDIAQDLKSRAPSNSAFDPPWTTVNIGRLTGGVAPNVIPGKAELDWEFRPVQDSDFGYLHDRITAFAQDTLLPAMRAVHPDAAIATEILGEVAGLEPMAQNEIRDLVQSLTGENTAGTVPFGTEAGLFQKLGMSVIVCGPGHIAQAHKPDEYLDRAQLSGCLDLLDQLGRSMT